MRCADRRQQRLGLHHHARTAPVGTVIHRTVRVGRVSARVFRPDAQEPPTDGSPHDAKLQGHRDHAREQRDHLDLHGAFYASSAGQSTRIVRAARSTLHRCFGAAGTQCSPPPGACVTITAPLGVSTKWLTLPSSAPSRLRSEEHTSELQSRVDLVCRLLLEKKKKNKTKNHEAEEYTITKIYY